jgi:hypothetical protein
VSRKKRPPKRELRKGEEQKGAEPLVEVRQISQDWNNPARSESA